MTRARSCRLRVSLSWPGPATTGRRVISGSCAPKAWCRWLDQRSSAGSATSRAQWIAFDVAVALQQVAIVTDQSHFVAPLPERAGPVVTGVDVAHTAPCQCLQRPGDTPRFAWRYQSMRMAGHQHVSVYRASLLTCDFPDDRAESACRRPRRGNRAGGPGLAIEWAKQRRVQEASPHPPDCATKLAEAVLGVYSRLLQDRMKSAAELGVCAVWSV